MNWRKSTLFSYLHEKLKSCNWYESVTIWGCHWYVTRPRKNIESFSRNFCTWANYIIPNVWLWRPGEIVAVSTNIEIPDQKSAYLLLAEEQLFQPYTYFSVTLYLHFHVVNPIYIIELYGARIVTYVSVVKLWFTIKVSASAVAPESPILFPKRLSERILQNGPFPYKD